MRVAIIGGTGYVGVHLVQALVDAGHQPRLLVRPGRSAAELPPTAEIVNGEVGDHGALSDCLADSEAAIYLIGILRENPPAGVTFDALQRVGVDDTIAAALTHGVDRMLLMSANGVRPDGTPYQRTKYQAEEALKASGLQWTIFRPSVIFGDPRGHMEFCTQLKRDLIDSPIPAPLFYSGLLPIDAGAFKLAPVAVEDVAQAFVQALADPQSRGQTYSLCGPDHMSWKEILRTIATAAGRSGKWMLPAPAFGVRTVASLLDRYPWFPVTRDQIRMLMEGNVCAEGPDGFARLGLSPKRFDVDSLGYLNV